VREETDEGGYAETGVCAITIVDNARSGDSRKRPFGMYVRCVGNKCFIIT
jgi:hypothetical protein